MNPIKIDFYLINQIIDIFLWGWIVLIMIKRVVCRSFDITTLTFREKFNSLIRQHHYYSDVLLLLASLLAVVQFSNQFYYHIVHIHDTPNILSRTLPWMIFHKILTGSILCKYRKSQPKIFIELYNEIKAFKLW